MPLPAVQTLPNTTTPEEVIEALKIAGGVVIKNFLSDEINSAIEGDLRPHIEADAPWSKDEFFPPETRRAQTIVAKSPLVGKELMLHPLWKSTYEAFLTDTYYYYYGKEKLKAVSLPSLNNSGALSVRPGAKPQPLHRDDIVQHMRNPEISEYPDLENGNHREGCVGLFVAGTKAFKRNGATRFIPGSHLWGDDHEPPEEADCVYAELERGDAFIMLGSCYHGGSANHCTEGQPNSERLLYNVFMVRGYFKQEENSYLTLPLEKVAQMPQELQKIVGYQYSEPFAGWGPAACDPLKVVTDFAAEHGIDLST